MNGALGSLAPRLVDDGEITALARRNLAPSQRAIKAYIDSRFTSTLARIVHVNEYGATADGKFLTDATIASTSGNAVVTSASNPFTTAHLGKLMQVAGAGAGGQPLSGLIASVNSAGSVTLNRAATATVSGVLAQWGTDNTSAFNNAIAALTSGGTVFLGPGYYLVSTINLTNRYSTIFSGTAPGINAADWGSVVVPIGTDAGDDAPASYPVLDLTGSGGIDIRDLQIGTTRSPIAGRCAVLIADSNVQSGTLNSLHNVFITSTWRSPAVYIYGTEEGVIDRCRIWNYVQTLSTYTSSSLPLHITTHNVFSMTSLYTTIVTGNQPCGTWRIRDSELHDYKPAGGATGGAAVRLTGVSNIVFDSVSLDSSSSTGAIVFINRDALGVTPSRILYTDCTFYNENGTQAVHAFLIDFGTCSGVTIITPSFSVSGTIVLGTQTYDGFSTP